MTDTNKMTFSNQIKQEIVSTLSDKERKFSCLYGIILYSKFFTEDEIKFHTESGIFLNIFSELLKSVFENKISIEVSDRVTNKYSKRIVINKKQDIETICQTFDIDPNNRRIDFEKISNGGISEFLSGIFLYSGSVSEPSREYRIEFNVPTFELANDLLKLFEEQFEMKAGFAQKKTSYIIYIENSENIEDLLTFMGAQQATIDLINIKIYKDVVNKTNRIKNCDLANINKSLQTAYRQYNIIKNINNTVGLDKLPKDLKEISVLRIENMDASLSELGQMLEKPISRSGVVKRFNKLKKIEAEILEKRGDNKDGKF